MSTQEIDFIFAAIGPDSNGKPMPIFEFPWHRGVAPVGYVKGMALCYARMLCKAQRGDPIATAMDVVVTDGHNQDALEWFKRELEAAAPPVDGEKYPQLFRLFVVLMGLGMQESTGHYFCGYDTTAKLKPDAYSAEAGAFQASWALNHFIDAAVGNMVAAPYTANSEAPENCFADIFAVGAGKPSTTDLKNFGAGDGLAYQRLAKSCPAYAATFAALGLRVQKSHWGTLSDHSQVQIRPEATELFRRVQVVVATKAITSV